MSQALRYSNLSQIALIPDVISKYILPTLQVQDLQTRVKTMGTETLQPAAYIAHVVPSVSCG